MAETGKVYLVGAGPGDPALVTIRAKALIGQCDVLIMDQLVNMELSTWVKPGCEVVLMGKGRAAMPSFTQSEIEEALVDRAKRGLEVVRLKGGDPFIYGRGGEEMEVLAEQFIPFEIVPGITAALAAASYTGIPLTHRSKSSSLVFLTGHEDPNKEESRIHMEEYVRFGGTLCIYMGMKNLDSLVSQLIEAGMDKETPVAVVQWATTPRQLTLRSPLGELSRRVKEKNIHSPAVIIIGEVAGADTRFSWFESKPLFGRRVLITRSRKQTGRLRDMLGDLGAEVVEIPLIEIRPTVNRQVLGEVFAEIATYEWIVFTSPNGVRYFFEYFWKAFKDIRSIGGARFAAIGEGTAREIEKQGLEVDLVPRESVAESLGEALVGSESLPSANVLVVTGNRNRDVLVDMLEEGEAIVDTLQVYETVKAKLEEIDDLASIREEGFDYVLFTSSSIVESYVENRHKLEGENARRKPVPVSMGPITSEALRKHDIPVDIEAEESSMQSLVDSLVRHVRGITGNLES